MAVRGLASIIVNGIPDETRQRKGLLVVSCSDRMAATIETALCSRFKNVPWKTIRRNPPAGDSMDENTIYSIRVNSLARRLSLLRDLRRERFDVVAVAWTGERSFAPLKVLSLLTNFGSLLALKEDGSSFYVVRPSFRQLASHAWMRWRTREKRWGRLWYRLGSTILIPVGIIYILAQALRYSFFRAFVGHSALQDCRKPEVIRRIDSSQLH